METRNSCSLPRLRAASQGSSYERREGWTTSSSRWQLRRRIDRVRVYAGKRNRSTGAGRRSIKSAQGPNASPSISSNRSTSPNPLPAVLPPPSVVGGSTATAASPRTKRRSRRGPRASSTPERPNFPTSRNSQPRTRSVFSSRAELVSRRRTRHILFYHFVEFQTVSTRCERDIDSGCTFRKQDSWEDTSSTGSWRLDTMSPFSITYPPAQSHQFRTGCALILPTFLFILSQSCLFDAKERLTTRRFVQGSSELRILSRRRGGISIDRMRSALFARLSRLAEGLQCQRCQDAQDLLHGVSTLSHPSFFLPLLVSSSFPSLSVCKVLTLLPR